MKTIKRSLILTLVVSCVMASQAAMAAPDSFTVADKQSSKQQISQFVQSQSITYPGASEKLDYQYKDILFEKLTAFEDENPDASETEINDYFVGLMEEYNRDNPEIEQEVDNFRITSVNSWFYNIIEGKVSLNADEQALFNANPNKGFKALVAGDEAATYTEYKHGYNGHNDRSDAFRHAAWNIWIIGFTSDSFWAEVWTSAHEMDPSQPQIEYTMDMQNNAIGRLYAALSNISENSHVNTTRAAIHNAYVSGSLYRIVNNNIQYFTGSSSHYVN